MNISDDEYCFVCGQHNESGLKARLEMDQQTQSAACRISISKQYQGWNKIVHGGILATLLDETCAYAGKTLAPHVVTAEMTVRYKKPVPIEQELYVHARVVNRRRRILEISAKIEIDGVIYAEADSKMFVVE